MSETKMLQLILDKVSKTDHKIDDLQKEVRTGFEKVNKRIDVLGYELAELQDDTPTRSEYKKLEKRVTRLEKSTAAS